MNALTLWQVHELFEYWNAHPPTHVLLGAYLGVGAGKQSSGSREELIRDVAVLGGSFLHHRDTETQRHRGSVSE